MCMIFTRKDVKHTEKMQKRNRIYAYKVVNSEGNSLFHKKQGSSAWSVVGQFVYSNRLNKKLTDKELVLGEVNKGLHFFKRYKDAKSFVDCLPSEANPGRIFKVVFDGDDLVASGAWLGYPTYVATRCQIKKDMKYLRNCNPTTKENLSLINKTILNFAEKQASISKIITYFEKEFPIGESVIRRKIWYLIDAGELNIDKNQVISIR